MVVMPGARAFMAASISSYDSAAHTGTPTAYQVLWRRENNPAAAAANNSKANLYHNLELAGQSFVVDTTDPTNKQVTDGVANIQVQGSEEGVNWRLLNSMSIAIGGRQSIAVPAVAGKGSKFVRIIGWTSTGAGKKAHIGLVLTAPGEHAHAITGWDNSSLS